MRRIPPRPFVAAAVAAAVASVLAGTSSQAAVAPSQASLAATLSRRVESASTAASRYQALLAVMKAFRIGVYTSAGRPVVRGAERTPRDFYVYDFELRALAAQKGMTTVGEL